MKNFVNIYAHKSQGNIGPEEMWGKTCSLHVLDQVLSESAASHAQYVSAGLACNLAA
jgi:hypothetical protein